jgi:hypothetical protein
MTSLPLDEDACRADTSSVFLIDDEATAPLATTFQRTGRQARPHAPELCRSCVHCRALQETMVGFFGDASTAVFPSGVP